MPKLSRSDWYDLARDTNWTFRYVTEDEVFPEQLSGSHRVSAEGWLKWDEPYKIGYREYVHNQVTKDTTTYSLKNAIGRSKFFDALDPGWKSVIVAHYGAITIPEYLASIGEARMGRFGGPPRGAIPRRSERSTRSGTARSRPSSPTACWTRSREVTGRSRPFTPMTGS